MWESAQLSMGSIVITGLPEYDSVAASLLGDGENEWLGFELFQIVVANAGKYVDLVRQAACDEMPQLVWISNAEGAIEREDGSALLCGSSVLSGTKFHSMNDIPSGGIPIPAGGFRLEFQTDWTQLSHASRSDLHFDFRLASHSVYRRSISNDFEIDNGAMRCFFMFPKVARWTTVRWFWENLETGNKKFSVFRGFAFDRSNSQENEIIDRQLYEWTYSEESIQGLGSYHN